MSLIRSIKPLWIVLLVSVLIPMTWMSSPRAAEAPKLEKAKGQACVKPAAWMRLNHMDFLKHQRDETVRYGKRVKDESLLNCKTCHVSREQFCDRCHTYVGVAPDCFHCHNYP